MYRSSRNLGELYPMVHEILKVAHPGEATNRQKVGRRQFSTGSAALFLTTALLAPSAFGDEPPGAPSIHFDIDAKLVYIEAFSGGSSSMIEPNAVIDQGWASKAEPVRTLGLGHMKVGLEYSAAKYSSLRMGLRPDANIDADGNANSGFDSRAGSTYRESEKIKLLDTYQLVLNVKDSFRAEVGVFDSFNASYVAFDPLLEFGLNVRFPRKFSGLKLIGNFKNIAPNEAQPVETGLQTELVVFQGDGDRVEESGALEQHFDEAPMARDPYVGGALSNDWTPSAYLRASLLVGFLESAYDPTGLSNESFGAFSLGWDLPFGSRWVKVAFSFRYSKEKWRVDDVDIESLVQQSAALSSAIQMTELSHLHLALHTGRSERHRFSSGVDGTITTDTSRVNPYSGLQIDLGADYVLAERLNLQLALSQEDRTSEDADGGNVGGFDNGTKTEDSIRRLAIGLKYQIDGDR